LYPVFKATRKSYNVTFKNPADASWQDVVISTLYGYDTEYIGNEPKKLDGASDWLYEFTGWHPKPEKIVTDMIVEARFAVADSENDDDTLPGYTLDINDIELQVTNANNIAITKCLNQFNTAVLVPETITYNDITYTVTSIGSGYGNGFAGYESLELIDLPDTITDISAYTFYNCSKLFSITLPEALTTIGGYAFYGCFRLKELTIPVNVSYIADAAIAKCDNLESINVADGNTNFSIVNNCLIDNANKKLLQGLPTKQEDKTLGIIPDDGSVTSLGSYCFYYKPITEVSIPNYITTIPSNAFSHCEALTEVVLPDTLTTLGDTCFAWCFGLENISLPEGLTTIMTFVFDSCKLSTVTIPSTVTAIYDRAFGNMPTLNTVEFLAAANGAIPSITNKAFALSGALTFILPWTKEQHMAHFKENTDIFFGALVGSTLKFINYKNQENKVLVLEKTEDSYEEYYV
jgi:hypothetical protein